MNLNINTSSLAGLKAELLRKQDEVKKIKEQGASYSQFISKPKKKSKWELSNKNIDERNEKDAEELRKELDENKKSEEALKLKAELYDKLSKDPALAAEASSVVLVNFAEKQNLEDDFDDLDDDDGVEFVDCLGRTRKCLKKDLEYMKEKDESLKHSMGPRDVKEDVEVEDRSTKLSNEMMSDDMKREEMRKKWEEQELLLLGKSAVHYQDVLFDEARTHGVGYYEFSTNEEERLKQQDALNKLRQETKQNQSTVQAAKQRRDKQMKERLKAARRRKRERLGLPPQEDEEEDEEQEEGTVVEEPQPTLLERDAEDMKKLAPMREWDIGKETGPMSQEKWTEMKRSERLDDFAPPMEYQRYTNPRTNEYRSPFKKEKESTTTVTSPQAFIDDMQQRHPQKRKKELVQEEPSTSLQRKGPEIPPPTCYGPSGTKIWKNQEEMGRSIEEGLKYLRRQAEEKDAQKERGMLDIV